MHYLGLDIGSLGTKCVVLDADGKLAGSVIIGTGVNPNQAAEHARELAMKDAGITPDQVAYSIATGYGRKRADADAKVTEITCHAAGAVYFFPKTRTVLDIGGQDTKVIQVSENSEVENFAMNDKCAAGTGRFLEVMARALEIDLEEMGPLSMKAEKPQKISSFCTVFGETEVISHLANGAEIPAIVRGLHQAISQRASGMLKRIGLISEITMSGGVSRNIGMRHEIEEIIGTKLNVCPESQLMGALGAALIAKKRHAAESETGQVANA